jgi:hypothetical protein
MSARRPSEFPDDERPTVSKHMPPAARAAKLVRDWRACSDVQRRTIERMADKLAKLPKKPNR